MTTKTKGISLLNYVRLRESMSREEFLREHNYPVLVQQRGPDEEQEGDIFSTVTLTQQLKDGKITPQSLNMKPEQGMILPVAKQNSSLFEGMINVGRTVNNDVVLDIAGVSKFHAYFSRSSSGSDFFLTDANSKNGAFIERRQLRPHAQTKLKDGDRVCFAGQLEFTFYSPERFHEMLGSIENS